MRGKAIHFPGHFSEFRMLAPLSAVATDSREGLETPTAIGLAEAAAANAPPLIENAQVPPPH